MPTFYPPLSHSSQAPITSAPYLQLNLHTVFNDDEDSTGTWEIWTDLPRLDDGGNVVSQPGEWRAIAFEPLQDAKLSSIVSQPNSQLSDIITLKSLKEFPASSSSPKTLYATVTVPATEGQEYAYTYRHITSSGETHWLGGIGGNGSIRLSTEEADVATQPIKTGKWTDIPENLNALEWSGVGIEWAGIEGTKKPVIHTIPNAFNVSSALLFLQANTPPHLSPLSQPAFQPGLHSASNTLQALTILGTQDDRLSLTEKSALPSSSNATFGLATNGSVSEALTAAYKAAKTRQERFHLAEATSDQGGDVVALIAQSPASASDKTYLVVYAPPSTGPQHVSVTLPNNVGEGTALAVVPDSGYKPSYIPASSHSSSRQVTLHLEAGPVADVLQLVEFLELRGAGSANPVWICAPDAIASEVGEEQIDTPNPASSLSPFTSFKEVKSVSIADEEGAVPAPPTEPPSQSLSGAYPTSGSESVPAPQPGQSLPSSDSSGWWIFRLIGRFFVDIWELIMLPFRSAPAITSAPDEGSTGTSSVEEEREVVTPPDERTPLLGSTSMSRGTSSSSTAVDSLASPQSLTTAKGDKQPKLANTGLITPLGDHQRPFFDQTDVPMANTVQIRSYAQMTFDHLPPFQFLLPPGTEAVESKLRFALKTKTSRDWKEVQPQIRQDEGRCVEILVDGALGEGKDWEVQVERL